MGILLLTVVLASGMHTQTAAGTQAAGQPAPVKEKTPEELAIERVQKLLVQTIDGSLPDRTLLSWLREVYGPTAKTSWELGGCGLQIGNPAGSGNSQNLSRCVNVIVSLDARRALRLLFSVDLPKPGVRPMPATFANAVLMDGDNPTRWIKSLSEAGRIR